MAEADVVGRIEFGMVSRRNASSGLGALLTDTEGARHQMHGDVHVRIWLGGSAFDYRATITAANHLVQDWHRKRWCAIEFVLDTIEKCLPERRLPNERLFLGP